MSDSEETEHQAFDFSPEFQDKIAGLLYRDANFTKRTLDLIEPEYFSEVGTQIFVRMVKDHAKKFGGPPDKSTYINILKNAVASNQLRGDHIAAVKSAFLRASVVDLSNEQYVAAEVETFAKHQAIQRAMIEALPLLDKGDFTRIGELMASASKVGLRDDFQTYDYYGEIENRTRARDDIASGISVNQGITTGYAKIDCHLYHNGWGRKELSVIMGAAKSGKSLSLGDFGKNASLAGYSVLYVSLEVSKEIIASRIDASLSDTLMSELVNDRSKVEAAIRAMGAKAGRFEIIDFPSGTFKVSALDNVLQDYRDRGIIFDVVIVDYADIMAAKDGRAELRDGLRQIYIDLRGLAHIWNVALLTATQTNRDGAKAVTAKATDVGDDWNKIRTADIVIGLNATDQEKAAGEARLYWAISRNTADGFSIRIKQNREKMQFLTDVIGVER